MLRAHFDLNLTGLLPAAVQLILEHAGNDPKVGRIPLVSLRVDLFEMSTGPKYGLEALRLAEEEKLGLTAIGRRLGITKRKANLAVQYGRELRAAGLTDPYVELTSPPINASRWRERGKGHSHGRKTTEQTGSEDAA